MTAKELIKQLERFDEDAEVLIHANEIKETEVIGVFGFKETIVISGVTTFENQLKDVLMNMNKSIYSDNPAIRKLKFFDVVEYFNKKRPDREPNIRIRFCPKDCDETFEGTLIEERKYSYLVIPDDNLTGTAHWTKRYCEIIN